MPASSPARARLRITMHALVEHEEPEAEAQVEVPLERAFEERVARAAIDAAVDLVVELHELALIGQLDRAEAGEQLSERSSIRGRAAFGGEPRRVALQHDTHLGDAREVRYVDVGDEGAAVGDAAHQLLVREPLQRLADRGAADRQLLAQLRLVHERTRRQREREDAVAYQEISGFALGARRLTVTEDRDPWPGLADANLGRHPRSPHSSRA